MTNQNINATRIEDQSDPATEMRLTDVELGSFVGGNVPFYDQPWFRKIVAHLDKEGESIERSGGFE